MTPHFNRMPDISYAWPMLWLKAPHITCKDFPSQANGQVQGSAYLQALMLFKIMLTLLLSLLLLLFHLSLFLLVFLCHLALFSASMPVLN